MEPIIDRKLPIPAQDSKHWIIVEEAQEHNLKGIDVAIPRDRFVVITGLSGSGKSSLAIDTLFVEGQRRFAESLSSYARQFLGQLEKPHVKAISGLSPAICIEQKTSSHNPRSTVATVTEIMDYLRILYSSIGIPHCPVCGNKIKGMSAQEIVDILMQKPIKTKLRILAPVVENEKGTHKKLMESLQKEGFNNLVVNGRDLRLDEGIPELDKAYRHDVAIVVDRIFIKEGISSRLTDSVEEALRRAEGKVLVEVLGSTPEKLTFNEFAGCPTHGFSIGKLVPRMFSFNNPIGACPNCMGLGTVMQMDPDYVITDKSLSVNQGAIATINTNNTDSWSLQGIASVLEHFGYNLDTPLTDLSKKTLHALLYGSGNEKIKFSKMQTSKDGRSTWMYEAEKPTEGILRQLERRFQQTHSDRARRYYQQFLSAKKCPSCHGKKLKKDYLAVTVGNKNIMEINELSIKDALRFFESLQLTEREEKIVEQVMKEILGRLHFLASVGLEYLTLNRNAATLSGGESQRIRLATQIGNRLVGVLYVLDEPSIGLHQRDNLRLLNTFLELRDLGNTVLVIEHDEETIRTADYILDMGPLAGINGGEVVTAGTLDEIMQEPNSLTAKYLRNELIIGTPSKRRKPVGKPLKIVGATQNNLQNITVNIPLGVLTVVTGVSGSGKSTLVNEILWKALSRKFNNSSIRPGKHKAIKNAEQLNKVIMIDQKPIGRTPRSNPATYTKVFDPIRDLFAKSPEAKLRAYAKGRFSFNVKGGRCEACSGNGYNKIEMSFLSDVFVECDVCHGQRFNKETLEITYKGKNIADVLAMDIEEAAKFFENVPKIKKILDTLLSVGCGYIKLGQSATTLSGGESQRIKLSRELSKRTTGNTLLILDEPSTGLHAHDVSNLLDVLHRLVDKGNTVLIIEHNLDVIRNADHIIDLGPEGGDQGGLIIASGTPEQVAAVEQSYTGRYLRNVLQKPVKAPVKRKKSTIK